MRGTGRGTRRWSVAVHGGLLRQLANNASDSADPPPLPHGVDPGPTVLLVEDEALIRFSVADALRAAGLRVVEAGSGRDASDVLALGTGIDLLFTDVSIPPGPDGIELARALRASRPEVPIVIGTAYSLAPEVA